MRVVLYATDFEPITILELSGFAVRHLEKYGHVALPVLMMPITWVDSDTTPLSNEPIPKVDIFAERVRTRRGEHLMLFTNNDEQALLLKAAFLPGQQSALGEAERDAFARGFLDALQRLGS